MKDLQYTYQNEVVKITGIGPSAEFEIQHEDGSQEIVPVAEVFPI